MDNGVRFIGQRRVTNASQHAEDPKHYLPTFPFWSVDMNSYLYREKIVLAKMAALAGNTTGEQYWTSAAAALLPRLRETFFVPAADGATADAPSCATSIAQHDCSPHPGHRWHNSSQPVCQQLGCCWHQNGTKPTGHRCIKKEAPGPPHPPTPPQPPQPPYHPTGAFFQDRYFNGNSVPVQGCEGFAALFCGVATPEQAAAMAATLSDPSRWLLNFSLPTVSKSNPHFVRQTVCLPACAPLPPPPPPPLVALGAPARAHMRSTPGPVYHVPRVHV